MKTFALTLVILAMLLLIVFLLKRRQQPTDQGPWPYYLRDPLSKPEQVLFHRLIAALPEHIVLAQVQVSRVLGVKKGSSNHRTWLNRIDRLSYDFLVCNKASRVLAAVELDDSSHATSARRATDEKKDKASKDAGLTLIRWSVKDLPDETAIQAAIKQITAVLPPT